MRRWLSFSATYGQIRADIKQQIAKEHNVDAPVVASEIFKLVVSNEVEVIQKKTDVNGKNFPSKISGRSPNKGASLFWLTLTLRNTFGCFWSFDCSNLIAKFFKSSVHKKDLYLLITN